MGSGRWGRKDKEGLRNGRTEGWPGWKVKGGKEARKWRKGGDRDLRMRIKIDSKEGRERERDGKGIRGDMKGGNRENKRHIIEGRMKDRCDNMGKRKQE